LHQFLLKPPQENLPYSLLSERLLVWGEPTDQNLVYVLKTTKLLNEQLYDQTDQTTESLDQENLESNGGRRNT